MPQIEKDAKRDLRISMPEGDSLAPKATWLISFPLSGSDYFIDVIHRLTEKSKRKRKKKRKFQIKPKVD